MDWHHWSAEMKTDVDNWFHETEEDYTARMSRVQRFKEDLRGLAEDLPDSAGFIHGVKPLFGDNQVTRIHLAAALNKKKQHYFEKLVKECKKGETSEFIKSYPNTYNPGGHVYRLHPDYLRRVIHARCEGMHKLKNIFCCLMAFDSSSTSAAPSLVHPSLQVAGSERGWRGAEGRWKRNAITSHN